MDYHLVGLLFVLVNIWDTSNGIPLLAYPNKQQNIFNTLLNLVKMNPLKNSLFYKTYSDNIINHKSIFESMSQNKQDYMNFISMTTSQPLVSTAEEITTQKTNEKQVNANEIRQAEKNDRKDSNEFSALLSFNHGNFRDEQDKVKDKASLNDDFEDLLVSSAKRMKDFNIK